MPIQEQIFSPLQINSYFNNKGISYQDTMVYANFTGMKSSFPAEQLPESNETVYVQDVPFIFPDKAHDRLDNFELNLQSILVPPSSYQAVHFLGTAENGSYLEYIELADANGASISAKFGLSDWVLVHPEYGEIPAFICDCLHSVSAGIMRSLNPTIWYQKVIVPQEITVLSSLKFNDNPSMHIFAITMEHK